MPLWRSIERVVQFMKPFSNNVFVRALHPRIHWLKWHGEIHHSPHCERGFGLTRTNGLKNNRFKTAPQIGIAKLPGYYFMNTYLFSDVHVKQICFKIC